MCDVAHWSTEWLTAVIKALIAQRARWGGEAAQVRPCVNHAGEPVAAGAYATLGAGDAHVVSRTARYRPTLSRDAV